jgi:hypothetical protein
MPDYSKGKIYKIVSSITDKFYVGSTICRLSDRMSEHRSKHNKCMSKNIGDLKECSIILIENYPCKDVNELKSRERFYFDKYKLECKDVFQNKYRPILYEGEKTKFKKLYLDKNKIEISKRQKEYQQRPEIKEKRKEYYKKPESKEKSKEHYQKNKTELLKTKKEYYEKNKIEISKRKKQYCEKNKIRLSEKDKETYNCECGSISTIRHKSRHNKSKKHINFINQ